MKMIEDYLCEQVKSFLKTQFWVLAPKLKFIWDMWLKKLLYDLAVNVIADLIARPLLK